MKQNTDTHGVWGERIPTPSGDPVPHLPGSSSIQVFLEIPLVLRKLEPVLHANKNLAHARPWPVLPLARGHWALWGWDWVSQHTTPTSCAQGTRPAGVCIIWDVRPLIHRVF